MHCELYNGKDFEKKTQQIHEIKKTKTERKEQTEIWKKIFYFRRIIVHEWNRFQWKTWNSDDMTAILVANFVCFESRKIPMVQMLNNFDTQNSKQSKAKNKWNPQTFYVKKLWAVVNCKPHWKFNKKKIEAINTDLYGVSKKILDVSLISNKLILFIIHLMFPCVS